MNILEHIAATNPWHSSSYKFNENIVDRRHYLEQLLVKNSFVKILIGPRRVGKSSILYSYIKHFCIKGSSKKILMISGDLIGSLTIDDIVNKYCEIKKILHKDLVLIIDEVQEIDDWALQTKVLYDLYNMKIIVTGSSSSAISEKMSKLTGRHTIINVTSLSFVEYSQFVSIDQPGMNKHDILEKYINNGGYPEQFSANEVLPLQYLLSALDSSLYRDLTSLYGINNPQYLVKILEVLADNISNVSSYNNISKRIEISDDTVKSYIQYLKSTFLVYQVFRNGHSNKITKGSIPKYYLSDIGFLNILSKQPRIGHKIENLVFLQLLQSKPFSLRDQIFYNLIGKKEEEIDFFDGVNNYEVKDILTEQMAENIQYLAESNSIKIQIIARKFEAYPRSNYIENIDLLDFLDSE